MKYLRMYESKDVMGKFGISEKELDDIISFLGDQHYGDIKYYEDSYLRVSKKNFGYEDLRVILNLYDKLKKKNDDKKTKEDFFLDLVDNGKIIFKDNSDFELIIDKNIDQLLEYLQIVKEKIQRYNLNIQISNVTSGISVIRILFTFR
jgi:hypothetical protein